MLTLAQCISTNETKKAQAARDVDFFGTLAHSGWIAQVQQSSQDTLNALWAKSQADVAAYGDIAAILDAQ